MIRAIKLTGFKCFEKLDLKCAPLNLLCGMNGMGKSSVIQALLLLRQSTAINALPEGRLVLNGSYAGLGTGKDVMSEYAKQDGIGFEIHWAPNIPHWQSWFEYAPDADQLRAQLDTDLQDYLPEQLRKLPPFDGPLAYVAAERIGPRKIYAKSETMAHHSNWGQFSEYAINHLHEYKDKLLPDNDSRLEGSESARWPDVADRWLQEITPGAHLGIESVEDADALIAGFSFDRPGDIKSRRYRATNVGFGLSYALPVLLALLLPKGTLCLIENPEAHLHPRGQTKLAELAVRAALAGVQVILETHSDHFMDGVRIAVRNQLISPDHVAFHYFERQHGSTEVQSLELDADGRLPAWPTGFFDQHEENLAQLLAKGK